MLSSEELNKGIAELDEKIHDFQDTGKPVPYIGWYWRDVNFDRPFPIGHCLAKATYLGLHKIEDAADFIGFMENNKWDHKERLVTEDERIKIRSLCEKVVTQKTKESCVKLCDYMQTLTVEPEEADTGDLTGDDMIGW